MTFPRTTHDITIGAPVCTRDGEELGTVREVRGTAFKVAAPMQPDYWLPTTCLAPDAAGRLVVEAEKARIGDLKVDEPRAG